MIYLLIEQQSFLFAITTADVLTVELQFNELIPYF